MILSHGMGASSYVPDALIGVAQDEVDHGLLAFLQCYARDPGEWEVMIFLADHSEEWFTLRNLALALGKSRDVIEQNLESLLEKRMIEERILLIGPFYRMMQSEQLCRRVRRLATTLREGLSLSM
jgi:hypothetical protein